MSWRPEPDWKTVVARAELYQNIRTFMQARKITEAVTSVMGEYGASAVHIHSLRAYDPQNPEQAAYYLQTSPEYALKKMLAHYHHDLYQITPAFRAGEQGQRHRPEFQMLEWYRLGLNYMDLAQEVVDLFALACQWHDVQWVTYAQLLQDYTGVWVHGPARSVRSALWAWVQQKAPDLEDLIKQDVALHEVTNLILDQWILPQLPKSQLWVLYEFMPTDAALAQVAQRNHAGQSYQVAERFECYYAGLELANGFAELCDAHEQAQRFAADNAQRTQLGLPTIAVDQALLEALPHMQPCSGVAVGLDRLLMAKLRFDSITQV